jgi:hypothetical protein
MPDQAKFKSLIFSVSGFALPNIANMYILVMLIDFGLLPAANGAENLILQALKFH